MKARFFGPPFALIKKQVRKPMSKEWKNVPVGRFDENGEFVTTDDELIARLQKKFKWEEITRMMEIEADRTYYCKHCGEACPDRASLMRHSKNCEAKNKKEDE